MAERKTVPERKRPGAPIRARRRTPDERERLFAAEAAYADSIFRSAMNDVKGSIEALGRALEAMPTYAPALLSMGSVEYQRGKPARGRRRFLALLDLPGDTPDLCEILDEAGDFLIQTRRYADGLELYRRASDRFPRLAVFRQGMGCCAGHLGLHDEAIAASRAALEIQPDNQEFVNDLGWSLYEAGSLEEARRTLERAVALDPKDELAAENLRVCTRALAARRRRARDRPG